MANLTIQLDQDALRIATSQALVGLLSDDVKKALIENAIKSLLEPMNQYDKRSKIQQAFDDAVYKIVSDEIAAKILEKPEMKERLFNLMEQAATKMLTQNVDDLIIKMRNAFIHEIANNNR